MEELRIELELEHKVQHLNQTIKDLLWDRACYDGDNSHEPYVRDAYADYADLALAVVEAS